MGGLFWAGKKVQKIVHMFTNEQLTFFLRCANIIVAHLNSIEHMHRRIYGNGYR